MVKINFLFSLFIVFSFLGFAQEIDVMVSTDSSRYLVGDYIHYNIKIKHKPNVEIYFPSITDSIKQLEFVRKDTTLSIKEKNYLITDYKFIFIGFDSNNVVIPSITIPYKFKNDTTIRFARTDSLQILVSTVSVDTSKDIKDIKKPIKIPFDWKNLLMWIVVIILVLVLVYFIYKKFIKGKKKITKEEIVIKLPHERALESLEELEKKQLYQKGLIKEYHTEITEIIRKYFEERFDFPAMELTTTEAINFLVKIPKANEIVNLTNEFLNNADMVKFAKFVPMNNINEEMMKQARMIIDKTIPREEIIINSTTEEKSNV
ncbi:MAG: hypothetical protein STSR0008_01450 [Ignavibacterium sp.]